MRRHADLVRLRHYPPLVALALVLAGCGGGETQAAGCSELRDRLAVVPVGPSVDATAVLRRTLDAERAALAALASDDPLAPRFRGAIARAERTLASVKVDPLSGNAGSMSPTATIGPATRRAVAEARSLERQLCE